MKPDEIIKAIEALTEVVKANRGLLGSEQTKDDANEKIRQLIKLLPSTKATPA